MGNTVVRKPSERTTTLSALALVEVLTAAPANGFASGWDQQAATYGIGRDISLRFAVL
jgi:acyl-CoA reductase-like NAD-dependent aldehyde dehydrogenase